MAVATGVSVGAVGDPQQRGCLSLSLATAGGQQQKESSSQTPPAFLVTQSLVSLLTERGFHCHSQDKPEHETNGEILPSCCQNLLRFQQCVFDVMVAAAAPPTNFPFLPSRCRKPHTVFPCHASLPSALPERPSGAPGAG